MQLQNRTNENDKKMEKILKMLNKELSNNEVNYKIQSDKVNKTVDHVIEHLNKYRNNILKHIQQNFIKIKKQINGYFEQFQQIYSNIWNKLKENTKKQLNLSSSNRRIQNQYFIKQFKLIDQFCNNILQQQLIFLNINTDLSIIKQFQLQLINQSSINLHVKSIQSSQELQDQNKKIKKSYIRNKKQKFKIKPKQNQVPLYTIKINY